LKQGSKEKLQISLNSLLFKTQDFTLKDKGLFRKPIIIPKQGKGTSSGVFTNEVIQPLRIVTLIFKYYKQGIDIIKKFALFCIYF
jgi:hypothetical protein